MIDEKRLSFIAAMVCPGRPALRIVGAAPQAGDGEGLGGASHEYVILDGTLDNVFDISDFLAKLRPAMGDGTLLIATTGNPLWIPLWRLAGRLGLRAPDAPRNSITNRDIQNVLAIEGWDVVEHGFFLPVPARIPLAGDFLNAVLPELPLLRFLGSTQYIAARPRVARAPLSCSVVIPCRDEEQNIAECVRRTPSMGSKTEILVVDDGSTDGTRRRVLELMKQDRRVRLIASDVNQGKAEAVRAGFAAARGDVLMILDADMTVQPEDLPRFFKPIQDGVADFVNGTRLVYAMEGSAMKLLNFVGNKAFCYLAAWILRQRVSDTLCGTKALMRRDQVLMPPGLQERWGDFDLLFGAAQLKLRIFEVPIHYHERRAGKSKMRVLADGWLFLLACWHGWKRLRLRGAEAWTGGRRQPVGWSEIPA